MAVIPDSPKSANLGILLFLALLSFPPGGRGAVSEREAPGRRRTTGTPENALEWQAGFFTVVYDGYQRTDLAHQALTILRQAYLDIGRTLGNYPKAPLKVIIYTQDEFMKATDAQEWAGGTFDLLDGTIRIPGRDIVRGGPRLKAVLYHEYSHALLHHLSAVPIPTWFDEGLAQHFEGKYPPARLDPTLIELGRDILRNPSTSFFSFESDAARAAYVVSLSLFHFLDKRYDRYGNRRQVLIKALGTGRDFPVAFRETFGLSLEEFAHAWEQAVGPNTTPGGRR